MFCCFFALKISEPAVSSRVPRKGEENLFQFKIQAIGVVLQVVRTEVEPEVGAGRLPLLGEFNDCFARGTSATVKRSSFRGFAVIETDDVYLVVIASPCEWQG